MSVRDKAESMGIRVDGRWSDTRIQEEIDKMNQPEPEVNKFKTVEWANAHAAKMWEGQSEAVSTLERVGRIRLALKAKGFERFDELVIPTNKDYKRYL